MKILKMISIMRVNFLLKIHFYSPRNIFEKNFKKLIPASIILLASIILAEKSCFRAQEKVERLSYFTENL